MKKRRVLTIISIMSFIIVIAIQAIIITRLDGWCDTIHIISFFSVLLGTGASILAIFIPSKIPEKEKQDIIDKATPKWEEW